MLTILSLFLNFVLAHQIGFWNIFWTSLNPYHTTHQLAIQTFMNADNHTSLCKIFKEIMALSLKLGYNLKSHVRLITNYFNIKHINALQRCF